MKKIAILFVLFNVFFPAKAFFQDTINSIDSKQDLVNSNQEINQVVETFNTYLSPTPWWHWLLLFLFSSFALRLTILRKSFMGWAILSGLIYIIIIKYEHCIETNSSAWPFYLFGAWTLFDIVLLFKSKYSLKKSDTNPSKHNPKATRLVNLAYDEFDRKNYIKAKALLEQALKIDNTIPDAHSEYSLVLSAIGMRDNAIDAMIKGAMLQNRNPKFWANLSFQYSFNSNFIKALTSLCIAEIISPSYKSIASIKEDLIKKFNDYYTYRDKCNRRAKEILKILDRRPTGLPLQSGDINHLMDPRKLNHFL